MEESETYPQVARIVNELLRIWVFGTQSQESGNQGQSCSIQYLSFVGVKLPVTFSSSQTHVLGFLRFCALISPKATLISRFCELLVFQADPVDLGNSQFLMRN